MTWEVLLAGRTITSPKHQEYWRSKPQSRKEVKQNTNTTHALVVVHSTDTFSILNVSVARLSLERCKQIPHLVMGPQHKPHLTEGSHAFARLTYRVWARGFLERGRGVSYKGSDDSTLTTPLESLTQHGRTDGNPLQLSFHLPNILGPQLSAAQPCILNAVISGIATTSLCFFRFLSFPTHLTTRHPYQPEKTMVIIKPKLF